MSLSDALCEACSLMAVIMAEQRSQAAVFYALWSCLVDGFGQGESVSGIKRSAYCNSQDH